MNLKKNFFRLDLFLFSCVKALTYMKLRMMALRRQGQVDLSEVPSQPSPDQSELHRETLYYQQY